MRFTKNLGSSANYMGDYEKSDQMVAKEEKVQIHNFDKERKEKEEKEKAVVKYNYQDFLKQFSNLTE